MGLSYYNEIDPYAAKWLRNLIAAGHIAPGDVDERSIEDVRPVDLRGYTQCHFFAGIGVWSRALRMAGWPDDRQVWTGSCPCQPFSAAGKGTGFDDERHLWPCWQWLIRECRPDRVYGEQVANHHSEPWIDLVHSDMEALGYAFAAVPFPAASVGAPHIRDRLYWVADASGRGLAISGRRDIDCIGQPQADHDQHDQAGIVGDTGSTGLSARERVAMVGTRRRQQGRAVEQPGGASDGMADAHGERGHWRGSQRPIWWNEHPDGSHAVDMADTARGGRHKERAFGGRVLGGDRTQGDTAGSVDGHESIVLADTGSVRRRGSEGRGSTAGETRAAGGTTGEQQRLRFESVAGERGPIVLADADSGSVPQPQRGQGERGRPEAFVRLDNRGRGSIELARPGPTNGFWRDADWIRCTDGKWRPVEPGTFPLADGVTNRVGRLRAYGNAINEEAARAFIAATN